jgi:hypothetical protein
MKFVLDDGNQHVDGYGTPNLRLHGVLARAQELLDAQVLPKPLEGHLHLRAALAKRDGVERLC